MSLKLAVVVVSSLSLNDICGKKDIVMFSFSEFIVGGQEKSEDHEGSGGRLEKPDLCTKKKKSPQKVAHFG